MRFELHSGIDSFQDPAHVDVALARRLQETSTVTFLVHRVVVLALLHVDLIFIPMHKTEICRVDQAQLIAMCHRVVH
jgi:hypothetical protein